MSEQEELAPWCTQCDNCGFACVGCHPTDDGKPTKFSQKVY